MPHSELREGLTFDDVLLLPQASDLLPSSCDVATMLTPNIRLRIPLVSSPMDTVTESRSAIAIAQMGGLGFIHRNLTIERQAAEVAAVKKYESGMIADPVTVHPEQKIADALATMERRGISGLPVVADGRLVGILTNRDLRFEKRLDKLVREVMTTHVITAHPGISLEQAKEILQAHRIEKLPLVDERQRLCGLITVKDMDKATRHPHSSKDKMGRLRVGAAIGVGPEREERAAALVRAGVDVLCIDTAHGHSRNVIDALRATKLRPSRGRRGGRQRRHRRRREGPDRRGRRRAAGRDGPRIDLHHAGDFGRRRAADHRDHGLRLRSPSRAASRWSPTAESASRATSSRRSRRAPRP